MNGPSINLDPSAGDGVHGARNSTGIPVVDVVTPDMLDSRLVRALPVEWLRARRMLPVRMGGKVWVLTDDPSRVEDLQAVALAAGVEPRPAIADEACILQAIERCYVHEPETPSGLLASMAGTDGLGDHGTVGETAHSESDLLERAESAPVTQLVNLILLEAVKQNASDIHFEPFAARLVVRYRIDGVLYERSSPPKRLEQALVSRLKVMARMDIAERRLPQDGMAQVRVGDRAIDIRVSTVPVTDGERVVLRLLNRESAFLSLEALGMDEATFVRFAKLLRYPNGIIVVSGPTGSGKTTTLYAALGGMDAQRRNILTIEDPVEYRLPGIGQIQVLPKIGLTFASGLRHILRQDPDVVLVGETRDFETAEIAVRASLTGHLVLTTLHTNDAPSAVMRLIDMGVEPYLLAACLRGVLGQRLVRRLCSACRESTLRQVCSDIDPDSIKAALRDRPIWRAHAEGCERCLEGYSGRIGLFELMVSDAELRDAIRGDRPDADRLCELARRSGMRTLRDDGIAKILDGRTDPDEVLGFATA